MKMINKNLLRTGAATFAASGLIAAAAFSASAHVTISPDKTDAGSYALLTVSVPHGCGSSPTNEVAIQIPQAFTSVTPTVNPGWDVEVVKEQLAEPIDDGHGGELTERVSEIVYRTDSPLAPDHRDAFVLSAKLPEAAGETLYFPTVQTCTDGESAWVEIPAEGADPHDLELPAPAFEVTASDSATSSSSAAASDSSLTPVVSWVALGLGALGLGLGGAAFARSRSK